MKRHYVYKIRCLNTGNFYIGCRSCGGDPEKDTKYIGSGAWCIMLRAPDARYTKTILKEFSTREEAKEYEIITIASAAKSKRCQNVIHALWNERTRNIAEDSDINPMSAGKLQDIVDSSGCFAKVLMKK